MNELRKHHLTKRLQAVKNLREGQTELDGTGITIDEVLSTWELSGLFSTGCPRCGLGYFWTPPFGQEAKGRVCSDCLLVIK
jgi:hypothetical protein